MLDLATPNAGTFLRLIEGSDRFELERAYGDFCLDPEVTCVSVSLAAYPINGPRSLNDPSDHLILAISYAEGPPID